MKKFLWQEKPIAVNSFNLTDVHKKYNIYQKCKFCCINCNIITILQLRCISECLCINCKKTRNNITKYGVIHTSCLNSVKDKAKNTKLLRYGSENYINIEKIKQVKLERYNDEYFNNCEKTKQTKLKKYNNPYYTNFEKAKCTKLKKYNDPFYTNQDKAKQTCLTKYNKETFFGSETWKEKFKKFCIETYGVEHPLKSDEIKHKIKETNLNKYGGTGFAVQELADKSYNTMKALYGVNYYVSTKEFKEKSKETCLKHFGVEHHTQSKEFQKYHISKYFYDSKYFDSSWELALYIFLTDHNIEFEYHPNIYFTYSINDKQHFYFPDFKINNFYIEIKGDFLVDKQVSFSISEEKLECIKTNAIIFLEHDMIPYLNYIKIKYGKKYLKQFKQHK